MVAELSLTILRAETGQSVDDLVQELNLHIAAAALSPCARNSAR